MFFFRICCTHMHPNLMTFLLCILHIYLKWNTTSSNANIFTAHKRRSLLVPCTTNCSYVFQSKSTTIQTMIEWQLLRLVQVKRSHEIRLFVVFSLYYIVWFWMIHTFWLSVQIILIHKFIISLNMSSFWSIVNVGKFRIQITGNGVIHNAKIANVKKPDEMSNTFITQYNVNHF